MQNYAAPEQYQQLAVPVQDLAGGPMGHQLELAGRCLVERLRVKPEQQLAPDPTRFQLGPIPQTESSQFLREDCHATYADRTASNE